MCGSLYIQQERVYNKAAFKHRCTKCRSTTKKFCPDCYKPIFRTSNKCKSCAQKTKRRLCLFCAVPIGKGSTFCLSCHNKRQDKGLSRKRTKFNASPAWAKARNKCFERDNHTCQKCGIRGGTLNAHHIKRYADDPKLRLVLSNLETVCPDCHKRIHFGEPKVA